MARRKQDLERTPDMPAEFLPLSHPTLVAKLPEGPGWIHEIKFDGWRMQLNVSGGRATWFTRNGFDWTARLGVLSVFAGELPDCIIDGEMCALDEEGHPSFSALQSAMASDRTEDLVFYAFDILFRGETDLRPYALETRKASLARVLAEAGEAIEDHIRYVEHFPDAPARQLHKAACEMRLEGIVSKRLDENYKPGRSTAWLKAKCRPGQELVVGGWKAAPGGHFKGLLTGVYEDGQLVYAGSVKNGFGEREVRQIMPRLKALQRTRTPFAGKLQPTATGGDRLHFVEPELVAQADIAEWTASRKVRQASYKGLRVDKRPEEVRREPDQASDDQDGATTSLATGGYAMGGRGGPEDELLVDGQEEVFSRAEVESGRIEHNTQTRASARDPQTCRRALREIGEIAAVAVLPDSQMSDQEALQNIAAIAEWVREEAPGARAECGDVIRQLNDMTSSVDLDALDDREALQLFGAVLGALETSDAAVFDG